jgi:SAM-dependent methyltransferase
MGTPSWFPDELAHAGEEHLDSGYVAGYDAKAGTDPTDEVALLRGLGLGESDTLVDLGAGTGTLALAAAPFCRRVVAVDVSPAMVDRLRQQADRLGLENVECVRAGFLSYAHQGEPADVVYSRHALHHLPDFWKAIALARIGAVLRPGGVLRLVDLVYSFEPTEAGEFVEVWLDRAVTDPSRGWTRAELATHLREEHSTFAWLLEPMLERAGFAIREARHDRDVYAAYTCVKTA